MKKRFLCAVASVWFGLFAGATGVGAMEDMSLAVTFSPANSVPTLHEPIYIDVTIRNHTAQTIQVDLGQNRKANFEFLIKTPSGDTVRPPRIIREGIGRVGRIPLTSGQTYQQRLLLNEWYQLPEPGDYDVEARLVGKVGPLDGPWTKAEWSAQLALRILPRNEEPLRNICEELAEVAVRPDSSEAASNAALTLSHIVDPVAVPFLERVLKESYFGKELAIQGLGRIANAEAIHVLRSAMADVGPELKLLIRSELRGIRHAK